MKYEFVEDIETGNFAVAKLMKNKETNELVAMKYLERGPKIDDRVASEITNHRKLSHPNIIKFREAILTPNQLAIVMDYAEGGELLDLVNNAGRFSEDEARFFFQQLISGVSYCHSMEICHRELNLENILVEWKGKSPCVKICDFGFSKSLMYPRARSTVGSPGYFAPEVFSQQEYDGKLADIWSCGVILYGMVVGALPFEDESDKYNIKEKWNRITNVRYEIPNNVHVSEDCRDLISRIFVFDQAKRITMEEIKKHPWFLKNLPREIVEEDERRSCQREGATTKSSCVQRDEDILRIVGEAKSLVSESVREVDEDDIEKESKKNSNDVKVEEDQFLRSHACKNTEHSLVNYFSFYSKCNRQ